MNNYAYHKFYQVETTDYFEHAELKMEKGKQRKKTF